MIKFRKYKIINEAKFYTMNLVSFIRVVPLMKARHTGGRLMGCRLHHHITRFLSILSAGILEAANWLQNTEIIFSVT